jgi:hypothetical protein
MCPADEFTVVTEAEPEDSPFSVAVHDQGHHGVGELRQ